MEGCDWITLQRGPAAAKHSFYHWAATFTADENGPSLEDFKKAIAEEQVGSVSVGYTQMAAYKHPLIANRMARAFTDPRNAACTMNYDDGVCPVAESVVPRLILAYVVEPEQVAREDAEKLHRIVQKLS